MPFTVTLPVRASDLDTNGHVRGSAYLDYADHARWALTRAAGVSLDALQAAGLGPVSLDAHIAFHRELRAGDDVTVSCDFTWTRGAKVNPAINELRRTSDGELVATLTGHGGLLDLTTRRLVPDPAARWRAVATHPELLGL